MPQTTTITPAAINPYARANVPIFDVQLLLLVSIVALVLGLLLAQQTVLRNFLSGTDGALGNLFDRRRASRSI